MTRPRSAPEAERLARRNFYLAIAAWAVVALVTLFGGHACTPRAVEARLETQLKAALDATGETSVVGEMDGQRALLRGAAATEAGKASVQQAALTAAGPGGWWFGGVTSVSNQVTVAAAPRPFVLAADKNFAAVTLRGHAPTDEARQALGRTAAQLFQNNVSDNLEIRPGAPANWLAASQWALEQLDRLQSGKVRFADANITIIGEAPQSVAQVVRGAVADERVKGFNVRVDLTEPGIGLAIPGLDGINLASGTAQDCQTAFQTLLRRNVINFETASAAIASESQPLLESLAQIGVRCDRFMITVAGHTDDEGDRALNQQLSGDRAQAVANALIASGVDPARIEAVGYGQERPVASNATEEGRAQNRRIEIAVAPTASP